MTKYWHFRSFCTQISPFSLLLRNTRDRVKSLHPTNTASPQNGRAGERGITLTRPRCRSRWPLTCRPSPGHCETLVEPPCLPQSSCAVVNMAFIITHRTTPCGRKMALPWVSNINALWTLSSKWNHHPQIALCNKLLYLQCSCHCLWIGCRYRSYVNGTSMLSLPTISKQSSQTTSVRLVSLLL